MNYVQSMRRLIGHQPLLLAGSNVIILNRDRQVLLQHRTDGCWGLPGGLLELGESLEDTARREVREETGLELKDLVFLRVFSGPEHFFTLANQDQIYVITALYVSRHYHGEIQVDKTESHDVRFFDFSSLPPLGDEYRHYLDYFLTLR
ncbi:NUDIX hydrolase [Musicola paradisiaca]|uniref:NUDIX hydrolase n=1 Tax=Musicola paradisiaca (strain Ech703) TaxID=579405 RepID=C6CCS0_MUSP7|nr:NUDIX domain-containing protein [Musicola paradisiaca]ACS86913.1 NUDIX hydrolase [Musicola paradisiaca Ech703]